MQGRAVPYPFHVAVRVVQASPVCHSRHILAAKVLIKSCQQADLLGLGAHKMDKFVPVVEHDVLVQIARPEDAVIVDEPLHMKVRRSAQLRLFEICAAAVPRYLTDPSQSWHRM